MFRRLTRLLILCFIAGLAIYFVTRNQSELSVSISDTNSVTASSGVIILVSFALGLLIATGAGAFYAFRGFLREQSFLRRERAKSLQEEEILNVRAFSASGDLKRAKIGWEKLIAKDPKNVLLRIELSEVLDRAGDHMQALKTLDEARQEHPNNDEVLYRAAMLHNRLGNLTAAVDNLALIISKRSAPKAVKLARDLSLRLGRFEDALEYNERLKEMEGSSPELKEVLGTIRAHILMRDLAAKEDELVTALVKHLLHFERCVVALRELARLRLKEGFPDEAAQCLQRAFKVAQNSDDLREARNIWYSNGFKDKAVSCIKTWKRDAEGQAAFDAGLELAKTYLLIGQDTDASYEIEQLEREKYAQLHNAKRELAIMKAIVAYRSRDSLRSAEAFREVESLELSPRPTTALLTHDKRESL